VLAKNGIALMQSTSFDGSMVSVTTVLAHSDGGYVSSVARAVPAKTDAQGIGSCTTYLRRYSCSAACGISQEDDDGNKKNLPRSDFGDYCPVTFVDEGFMVKGDPEKESLVFGKTYLFATEKEQEIFNKDPVKYMIALTGKAKLPLQAPLPKIMLIGNRGSGVTT
jgi:YHS domain-containing protein